MAHIPKAIWRRLSNVSAQGRSSHSVSITPKGQLLIHGGEFLPRTPVDNSPEIPAGSVHSLNLTRALAHTTEADFWTILKPQGTSDVKASIPEARVGAATTWNSVTDRLYLWGGRGGTSMNPFPNEQCGIWEGRVDGTNVLWTRVIAENEDDAPESRSYHTMLSFKNKVYIHAGCPASGRLESLHSFDVHTKRWERLADAPLPGRGGTALALIHKEDNADIIRFGGFAGYELPKPPSHSLDIYHISSNTWSTITPTPDPTHGYPGPRSVHGFVPFTSTSPGLADAVAILFHGEREASNLGHAGAGAFWDDVWVLNHTRSLAGREDASGGFSWKKATVEGNVAPEGRGWFPGASFVDSEGKSKAVIVGGLLGTNERSGETWVLDLV